VAVAVIAQSLTFFTYLASAAFVVYFLPSVALGGNHTLRVLTSLFLHFSFRINMIYELMD